MDAMHAGKGRRTGGRRGIVAALLLLAAALPGALQAQATAPNITATFTGPATYTPGTAGETYTLAIGNAAGTAADSPAVTTTFPTGTTVTAWTCTAEAGATCPSPANGSGNLAAAAISLDPASAGVTFTFTVSYAASMTAPSLSVGASVNPSTNGENTINRTVVSTRAPQSDLSVTKTSNWTQHVPEGQGRYTVTVHNDGPSDVSGFSLTDSAPAGTAFGAWTCVRSGASGDCPVASGSGSLALTGLSLPAGATDTYSVVVGFTASAGASITNTATLGAIPAGVDPDTTDHSASVTTTRHPSAAFDLSFVTPPATYVPGTAGNLLTLRIRNTGSTEATVPVAMPMPALAGLVAEWACASGCDTASGSGGFSADVTVPAGDAVDVVFTLDYPSNALLATLGFEAVLDVTSRPSGETEPSPDPADRRASLSLAIERQADIRVVKTASMAEVPPGLNFTYDITVINLGPSDIGNGPGEAGALLDDAFPASLQGHTLDCAGQPGGPNQPCWSYCPSDGGTVGSYTHTGCAPGVSVVSGYGSISDLGFKLRAGSQSTLRASARVALSASGQIDNTATVVVPTTTPAVVDPESGNNTSTASILSEPSTDIAVEKTDGVTQVVAGTMHSYTVTVRNLGYFTATNVAVSDLMPLFQEGVQSAGFKPGTIRWQCAASDGACCAHNAPVAACGIGTPTAPVLADALTANVDLPGLSSVEFTITGEIDARATGVLSNTATITVPPGGSEDVNEANDSSTDDDTAILSDAVVDIQKRLLGVTDEGAAFRLDYEIVVSNAGPSRVVDAIVEDTPTAPARPDTATWTCEVVSNPLGTTACDVAGGSGALSTTVDIDAGGSVRFALSLLTEEGATAPVVNTAEVTIAGSTRTASVTTTLRGAGDLAIHKTDNAANVVPGTLNEYVITVTNSGPNDVFGARVTDLLPPEFESASWTCEATTPVPGDLSFASQSGSTAGGHGLVSSADGRHVYVISRGGVVPSVSAYARDAVPGQTFGRIALLETEQQGVNDPQDVGGVVTGLQAPVDLALSPDGTQLFVLSQAQGTDVPALVVFDRSTNPADPSFGKLSFAGRFVTGAATDVPQRLLVTQGNVYVSGVKGGAATVSVFRRSAASGLPTFDVDATSAVPAAPAAMALSIGDARLFVASSSGGAVAVYSIEPANGSTPAGRLVHRQTLSDPTLSGLKDLALAPAERQLYVAATGSGHVGVLRYGAAAASLETLARYSAADLGLPAGALGNTVRLALAPDGEHLLLTNAGTGGSPVLLGNLRRDRNSGGLSLSAALQDADATGVEGASDVLVTPDGRHVLLSSATGGAGSFQLTAWARRAPDPVFGFLELDRQGDGTGDAMVTGLNAPTDTVVSPVDGAHVYAVSLDEGALTVFRRDTRATGVEAADGAHLVFERAYRFGDAGMDGLQRARRIAISPDGATVYVSSEDRNTLAVFHRDTDKNSAGFGALTAGPVYRDGVGGVDGLLGAQGMALDASGSHLYIAGAYEAAVATFRRNADGTLAYLGVLKAGTGGAVGMNGMRDLQVTGDGLHVLGVSALSNAVVVLRREASVSSPNFGRLTFQQAHTTTGVRLMSIALPSTRIDPTDNQHIYVVGQDDNSIIVLRRVVDPSSTAFGAVSTLFEYRGVPGVSGPRDIALSADGRRVFVASQFSHSVVVFDRDLNRSSLNHGGLFPVEARSDGADGVDGLNNLYTLAGSADARNVYVAGFGDRAIASFAVSSGSFCSAAGNGAIDDRVNIGAGGTLVYRLQVMVRPDATGTLENCASVIAPERFDDPDPGNNTACDSSALVPQGDVSISKTNERVSVVAGESVRYTVEVRNPGPSNLVHSAAAPLTVTDIFSTNAGFVSGSAVWTCEASGSGGLDFVSAYPDGSAGATGLAGVSDVALLPDADGAGPLPALLAAAGVLDNAVTLFVRDPLDGQLSQAFTLRQGDVAGTQTANALEGARAVLGSPDGRFLYVAARVSDAISVFRVEADGSGGARLALVEVQQGRVGLDQAVHMALAPDGGTLYVAGANDDAIAVFRRDPVDGRLTWLESEQNGLNDASDAGGAVAGLDNPLWLVASPDGAHLYALASGGLVRFERSAADGRLVYRGVQDGLSLGVGLAGLSSAVFDPAGEHLYVSAADDNRVAVLARNTTSGVLSLRSSVTEGVGGTFGLLSPRGLAFSADGAHLYVAAQGGGSVAWFSRDPATAGLRFLGLRSNDSGGVDGMGGATALVLDDALDQLYVAGTQQGSLVQFARSADSWCPPSGSGDINAVPVNIAAGGSVVFTIDVDVSPALGGPLTNTATVAAAADPDASNNSAMDVDSPDLVADLRITKDDGLAAFDGLAGARAVAGSARHLYVAGSGDNGIGIFARRADSAAADFGALRFIDAVRSGEDGVLGLNAVADLLLSPDGAQLYAVSPVDNAVVAFRRDNGTGQLTTLGLWRNGVNGITGMSGARALALSPDGRHLYVAAEFSSSVAMFARNADAGSADYGRLTFMGVLQQGLGGVDGLSQVQTLAVAPDGLHVYALGTGGSTLAVLRRNPNSGSSGFGQLTFVKRYAGAAGGASGLESARALAFDGSGAHLYVLGDAPGTLARFARTPATGDLALAERLADGQNGVIGLAGAQRLRLSHDGLQLYVAGGTSNTVSHYDIGSDGVLAFAGQVADGDPAPGGGNVAGLGGVSDLWLSPDGEHAYATAALDSALSGFDRVQTAEDLGTLSWREVFFDGLGGIAPGASVTYRIVVSNAGPARVNSARVVDVFPDQFVSVTWLCPEQTGGGSCIPAGTGDLDTLVTLPAGASVTFEATGVLGDSVGGTLVNTATVMAAGSPAATDPDISNNSATDGNTVLSPAQDLEARIDGIVGAGTPGAEIGYQVRFINHGPTYASGATLTDTLPFALRDASWTCSATPVAGVLTALQQLDAPPRPQPEPPAAPLPPWAFQVSAIAPGALGQFVYVAATLDGEGAVIVYRRSALDGTLTWVETHRHGVNGVSGLSGVSDLVLSSDERFLYAAGTASDAITLFARDSSTGRLTYVRQYQDGLLGLDGLGGVRDLLLAPGGTHLYAAGTLDDAIAIFSIQPGTGLLTQTGLVRQSQPGMDGLNGVNALAFAPGASHVFATALDNQSLVAFARNPANGALTRVALAQAFELGGGALSDPVALSIDGALVRVASGSGAGIDTFRFDASAETPAFERIDSGLAQGVAVSALRFDPDQARLYVASDVDGAVQLYNLRDGAPALLDTYASAGVRALALSSVGRQLYVGGSQLGTWARERGSRCAAVQGSGGIGRQTADIAPGGHLDVLVSGTLFANAVGDLRYVAEVQPRTLASETEPANNRAVDLRALAPAPTLTATKTDDLDTVVAGETVDYRIELGNDGVSAAVGAQVFDAPPYFPLDGAGLVAGDREWTCGVDPALAPLQTLGTADLAEFAGVGALAIAPDGAQLYAVSPAFDALLAIPRDAGGALGTPTRILDGGTLEGAVVRGLDGASSVASSPDGRHVVVAGTLANSVAVFSVEDGTGALRFVQAQTSGSGGVVGMQAPEHVVFGASGEFVYVAAQASDSIAVFRRDAATGALAFVERVRDGFGTIAPDSDVIRGVQRLHASADGRSLYALSRRSNSVAHFAIDAGSGRLTYRGVIRQADVAGIAGVRHLAASPGDAQLYLLGNAALVRFERQADGSLQAVETLTGVPGLAQPRAVVLDRDGSRTYLVEAGGGISVYLRDWATGALSFRQHIAGLDPAPAGAVSVLHAAIGADLFVAVADAGQLIRHDERPLSWCPVASASASVIETTVDIDVGGRVHLAYGGRVHPSARGVLTNTVRVDPRAGSDPSAVAGEATDETTIVAVSALSVEKTGPERAVAGTPVHYQIRVGNDGPSDALGMRVVDLLPPALLDVAWTCVATGNSSCPDSGAGSADIAATLLVGDTLLIDLHARIDPAFVGTLENRVELVPEVGATDPDLEDNADVVATEVVAEVDVQVSKSDGVDVVTAGTRTTYFIEVANAGPSDAPQVRLQDPRPAGVATMHWTCYPDTTAPCPADGSGTLDIDVSVPAGTRLVLAVEALVSSTARGTVENTVTATVPASVTELDPGNNSATDTNQIDTRADVMVSLADPLDPFDPGGSIPLPYLVSVDNLGPSSATGLQLVLTFSSPVSFVPPAGCALQGQALTCALAELPGGDSWTASLSITGLPAAPGYLEVYADVTAAEPDPDTDNNGAFERTELVAGGDLSVSIERRTTPLVVGDEVDYVVTVTNLGSQTVEGFELQVPAGAYLLDPRWTCTALSGAACAAASGTGDIAETLSLARGRSLRFVFTGRIDPSIDPLTEVEVVQTATAVPAQPAHDINPDNNSATDRGLAIHGIFRDGFEEDTP